MPADVIDFTDLVEHDVTSTDDFQTLCELGLFPAKYLVHCKR